MHFLMKVMRIVLNFFAFYYRLNFLLAFIFLTGTSLQFSDSNLCCISRKDDNIGSIEKLNTEVSNRRYQLFNYSIIHQYL